MPLSVHPIRYLSCVTRRPVIPSFPHICVFIASFFLNAIRGPRFQPRNASGVFYSYFFHRYQWLCWATVCPMLHKYDVDKNLKGLLAVAPPPPRVFPIMYCIIISSDVLNE